MQWDCFWSLFILVMIALAVPIHSVLQEVHEGQDCALMPSVTATSALAVQGHSGSRAVAQQSCAVLFVWPRAVAVPPLPPMKAATAWGSAAP